MTFSEFAALTKNMPLIKSNSFKLLTDNPNTLRRQVSEWVQKGWLLELKRGTYVIADLTRRSPASATAIANYLIAPSYVSLETALSHYRLIPERVNAITCVTSKKTQRLNNPLGNFIYHHVKQASYRFFIAERDEFNREYYIATPEKALIDYLYFHTASFKTVPSDYFTQSLRLQNTERLCPDTLIMAAAAFNQKKLMATVNTLIKTLKDDV